MSQATRFFNRLVSSAMLKLNTVMPCKVVDYNKETREAKIQPLFMVKDYGQDPEKLPALEDVPVMGHRYEIDGTEKEYIPMLKKGDLVVVVFAQRALDNVLDGDVAYPEIQRHHDLQDAIIIGILNGEGFDE